MKRYSRLPKETQHDLLSGFCDALCSIKTTDEAMKFLTDLLTASETLMLAKRIRIAQLLIDEKSYNSIEENLNVSQSTIAKVAAWLTEAGEGFRLITERMPKRGREKIKTEENAYSEWRSLKRRYPVMFWPQLLVEEIVQNANRKQKQKIQNAIKKLDHKSKVYMDVVRVLKSKNSATM